MTKVAEKKEKSEKVLSVSKNNGQQPKQVQAVIRPPEPTQEEIRLLAYLTWEESGKPEGDGSDFWLNAEAILRSQAITATLSQTKQAKPGDAKLAPF